MATVVKLLNHKYRVIQRTNKSRFLKFLNDLITRPMFRFRLITAWTFIDSVSQGTGWWVDAWKVWISNVSAILIDGSSCGCHQEEAADSETETKICILTTNIVWWVFEIQQL